MHTRTATAGLLPASKASKATRTIFQQSPLWFCLTKEIHLRTSNQYATNYSSFWKMKVLQTKSMQTLVFDPGGSKGRVHACPFLGTRCTLFCRKTFVWALLVDTQGWSVFGRWMTRTSSSGGGTNESFMPYVLRLIAVSPRSQADTWSRHQTARGRWGDERMSENTMERKA